MFWVFVWIFVFATAALASLGLGIAALATTGKDRIKCVDALLVLGTVVVLMFVGLEYVPKETPKNVKKMISLSAEKRASQADFHASLLTGAQYMDDFQGPFRIIMVMDGCPTLKSTLPKSEKTVQALVDKYPEDPALAARLIVLKHASGEPILPGLLKYKSDGDGPSTLLNSLYLLYGTDDKSLPEKNIEPIKNGFPDGWYRQTVLKDAYKKTADPSLKNAVEEYNSKSKEWGQKALIIQLLALCASIPALLIIYKIWKTRTNAVDNFTPICRDFRACYGTLLSVEYAQATTMFTVSIIYGVAIGLSRGTLNMDNFSLYASISCEISGCIMALITFYFFICRPQSISLATAYMRGSEGLSLSKGLKTILATFCCMLTISLLIRCLCNLIPNFPQGPSNSAQISMLYSMFATNSISVLFYASVICLVGPFFEELLCRGIIFGWLRDRYGFWRGAFGSALIFAALHFDAVGLPQYFAMGMIFAFVYERTKSLPVVFGCHALWNTFVLVNDAILLVR